MHLFHQTVRVPEGYMALLYKNQIFDVALPTGEHTVFAGTKPFEVEYVPVTGEPVTLQRVELLYHARPQLVAKYFEPVETTADEFALVYRAGRLKDFVPPGRTVFYGRALGEITVERLPAVEGNMLPEAVTKQIDAAGFSGRVHRAQVREHDFALLYIDGVLVRSLEPGSYAFLASQPPVHEVKYLSRRQQILEVAGQEILTKDRIGLRVNLTGLYRITDPLAVVGHTADLETYLYKEAQIALRAAIGTRTLDEVLAAKNTIDAELEGRLTARFETAGVALETIGIKDVILPGEVREILNQVVQAEKTAQANLIKRREETAATRALLNTAKLMEDNPVLLRLAELEALERVVEKVGSVTVNQGLEGLLTDLVRLKTPDTPRGKDAE